MESLMKHPVLEYNPNTLEDVRKKYDLENERMKEAVDILDKWVKNQKHFKNKDFPQRYLENVIISCKGSLERAKKRIDKMCTFRTLMPQYFGEYDLKEDFKDLKEGITCVYLPKLTPDNSRVMFLKVSGSKWYPNLLEQLTRLSNIYGEILKTNDCNDGFVIILDYRELDIMEHTKTFHPVYMRQGISIAMEGAGVRVRGIHMITPSKAVEVLVGLLKQVISTKIGNRIHVHKDIDGIYEYVPKDILPKEYGGKERSLQELEDRWIEYLSTKENKESLKMLNESGTDESLRESSIFNEEYLGMPGTFRTLSVD